MSRGLGKVERQILNVLGQQAVGLDIRTLAEALPELQVRGIRRAVQQLERQGQLNAKFHAVRHEQVWGGTSCVKVVSLVNLKVELQDGGASYSTGSIGDQPRHYVNRSRKHWQAMERKGYTLLPHVRKQDVYEAIGAVLLWKIEEQLQYSAYQRAWQPISPTAITGEEVRQQRARWQQAQALLDQARERLTALVKAPGISQEHQGS